MTQPFQPYDDGKAPDPPPAAWMLSPIGSLTNRMSISFAEPDAREGYEKVPLYRAMPTEPDAETVRRAACFDELVAALRACLAKGSRWHPCDPVVVQSQAALAKAEAAL